MNKFSFCRAILLCSLVFYLVFVSCKKDLAKKYDGEYIGRASTYDLYSGVSQNFPDARANVTRLSRNVIKLDMVTSSSNYTFSIEETLKKDGTFGKGMITPRGSFLVLGSEGKFVGDSLHYSSADGHVMFSFGGRK